MENIEKLLIEYDRIVIVEEDNIRGELFERIQSSDALRNSRNKVKVISSGEYPEMTSLFYMYEFSDKVKVIGRSGQYGGLLNLADAGLIMEEEVFEAIMR